MLKTERLTLRPLNEVDAPALAAAANDYEIAKWLTRLPHPYGFSDAMEFIPRAQADGVFLNDELIGMVGYDSAMELGYWYVQSAWGQGYATEAAQAVLKRHFVSSDDGFDSGYILGNGASERVLTKLGFEKTKLVTEPAILRKQVRIQKMYLSKKRWDALEQARATV